LLGISPDILTALARHRVWQALMLITMRVPAPVHAAEFGNTGQAFRVQARVIARRMASALRAFR